MVKQQHIYLNHYQLKVKPFDLTPKPDFLWLGEKHKEALATLSYGIAEELGFLLLTGDVGVGKTALIHRLFQEIDSSTIVAHITDPGLGTLDFFKLLAIEFGIATDFQSKGQFLIELETFLRQAHKDGKSVLLVIDEAQRLSNKLLDQIRVLSNIELSDRKLINIFFVGQPEFKRMLTDNTNRAIRQRIALNYHIGPLTESETGDYIEHRLKLAGAVRKIFKPKAVHEIFEFTGGFPRAINIICDHALLTGYSSGLQTIGPAVIQECVQELSIRAGFDFKRTGRQHPDPPARPPAAISEPPGRRSFSGYALLVVALIGLSALGGYFWLWPEHRRTMLPERPPINRSTSKIPADSASNEPPASFAPNEKHLTPSSPQTNAASGTLEPEETDAAGRQPAIVIAQAPPPPEPLPDRIASDRVAEDAFRVEPDKSEGKASPVDPSGTAPQRTWPYPFDWEEESRPKTGNEADAAGTPPAITTAQAPSVSESAPADAASADAAPDGESLTTGMEEKSAILPQTTEADPDLQIDRTENRPAGQEASPTEKKEAQTERPPESPAAQPPASPKPPVENPTADSTTAAAGNSTTDQSTSITAKSNDLPAPKAEKIGPPPMVVAETPAATGQSIPAKPVKSNPAPTTDPAAGQPKPNLPAKTVSQSPSEPTSVDPPSAQPTDIIDMEDRINEFLEDYCNTYEAKDLDAFAQFFADDAIENGKPFSTLLPKYERNFNVIESIQYRIELQQFSYGDSEDFIKINGDFYLKWLLPGNQWRENSGTIFMRLKEKGSSFVVHRLDYQGGRTK